ncbi:lytic transglycosylase domain-containing protein [Campylobacter majalis]|uniref:lytic transglycosylase domain-containing protein n=1 Tax=Campylobacter majalis TaxID=2790656 RepID=UPI003D6822F4
MILLRLCSLVTLCFAWLNGGVLSYDELKTKPKSLAKDYYINRLINEANPSKEQVYELSKQLYRDAGSVKKSIQKIIPPKRVVGNCAKVNSKNIIDANTTCQNALTTVAYSLKLDKTTREILSLNLVNSHPKKSKILSALNTKNPAFALYEFGFAAEFLGYYNAISDELKTDKFSFKLSQNFMNELYKTKGFTQFLINLVMKREQDVLRSNFLLITPEITSKNDAFYLGINAVTLGDESMAKLYFKAALNTYEFASQKDNAKFWLYLLGDDSILHELANSTDINIYSLYAKEITGAEPFDVYVPRPKKQNNNEPDITNPFTWVSVANSAEKLDKEQLEAKAREFYTIDSVAAYVYFMQKANGYKKHYYIIPENDALNFTNDIRKALIFAIARQESLFLPAVVSTSYALGTMQFMPFLANAIGKKELKIPDFDEDHMFRPDVAYTFANHHLNYLEKYLYHPLFIAYAYNGGIGFTKRLITKDDMFKAGKYEPFLSMELVPYAESRLYGKKVLANYVVYRALFKNEIKISELFDALLNPQLTDNFRK